MKYALPLLFLFLGCSRGLPQRPVCNFAVNAHGEPVSWQRLPVKMYVGPTVPTSAYQAIQNAADTWNFALGAEVIHLEFSGGSSNPYPIKDGYNEIYFQNNGFQASGTEEGVTTVYWSSEELFEADIAINTSFNYDQNGVNWIDLESLMLHELGHSLGLVHVQDQSSVMYPILNPYQIRRTLGAIDISDISCEY